MAHPPSGVPSIENTIPSWYTPKAKTIPSMPMQSGTVQPQYHQDLQSLCQSRFRKNPGSGTRQSSGRLVVLPGRGPPAQGTDRLSDPKTRGAGSAHRAGLFQSRRSGRRLLLRLRNFPTGCRPIGRRFLACDSTWRAFHTARSRLSEHGQPFYIATG